MKGIIGKKVGMTQVFDNKGTAIPVTVIQAGPCYVTQVKTDNHNGYSAIQLGFEEVPSEKAERLLTKAERGHLGLLEASEKHPQRRRNRGIPALRYLREFRVGDASGYRLGQAITVDVFDEGDHVDVVGTSKGRGFAGTIKRHNFRRQPKTHGQSDRERAPGSIGATSTPGRVFKGKKMAGRMGNARVTAQNLEVVVIDAEHNLLAVKGSVPGGRGGLVTIHASKKS
jgi:large subunit ribosomal protein L3